MICLPKFAADAFRVALKEGKINPDELVNMDSAERRAFFESILKPEEAKFANAQFESKLLLKNQQQGIINWAKKMGNMKPEVQRDILSKVEKLDRAMSPGDEQLFLADLVEKKLGVGVSYDEAQAITSLSHEIKNIEQTQGKNSIDYGRARVAFDNLIGDLKSDASKLNLEDFKNNPLKATGQAVSEAAGFSKAIKASLDNSAIFRQGWKTLWTHPKIWAENAAKSFSDLVRQFGGQAVMDEVRADVYSRENFDLYKKAKLAVGVTEEAFPTRTPEKIPLLGRAYKASESAFTSFQYRNRVDIFDKYIEMAKRSGVDVGDVKELQSIGQLVNSLTGRGNLGALEPIANTVNNVFFSPRFVKSQLDLFTQPMTGGKGSSFVRKQAAINLVKVISGTAAVLVIADAVSPGSVNWDPRSSDFGQIKVGNTRFDVSGGSRSLITLAARMATQSTKQGDHTVKLNTGKFGAPETKDVVYDFFSNKLSPAASVVNDYLIRGTTFKGEEPTVGGEAKSLLEPLPLSNLESLLNDPDSANTLAAMIADSLGIGTNTYGSKGNSTGTNILDYIKSLGR